MEVKALARVLFFVLQVMTLRINIEKVCSASYDKTTLKNQISLLEKAKLSWEMFKGVAGMEGQIALYQNRPVFKIAGDTLADHLRKCSTLGGASIEFITAIQQTEVNQIMRGQRLDKMLIYLTYSHGQLLWPSGKAFQYQLLDVPAKTQASAKQYKGTIQYKSYNKQTKAELNEFQFISDVSAIKSFCVANDNELYQEVARFKNEIQLKVQTMSTAEPSISGLVDKIITRMESDNTTLSLDEAQETQCWPVIIGPVKRESYREAPKVKSFTTLIKARQEFQTFKESYETTRQRLIEVKESIDNADDVQIEMYTPGVHFLTNFSLKKSLYRVVFGLIMVTASLIVLKVCYCFIFVVTVAKIRNPQHHMIANRYRPVEQIPLSQRID